MFAKHFTRRAGLSITVENDTTVVDPADAIDTTTDVVDAPTDVVVPDNTTDTPLVGDEVEAELDLGDDEFAEAEGGMDAVDVEVDNINTAADQGDTLDTIADKLEVQEENGGATPETMEIVEVAVEHCVATLQGFRPRQRVTPSLESFGGPKRRVHATQVTVEGIREWAQTAAKAIGDMVEKVIAVLKEIWASIQNSTTKLKQSLQDLRARVKAAGSNLVQGTVKLPQRVMAALGTGGKVTKETLLKGLASIKGFVAKVLNLMKITRTTSEQVVAKTNEVAEGESTDPQVDWSAMSKAVADFGGNASDQAEGVTVRELELLPGDVFPEITGPAGEQIEGQSYRVVSSVDLKLNRDEAQAGAEGDDEMPAMSGADLDQVAAAVDQMIGDLDQVGKSIQETVATENKLLAAAKSKLARFKEGATSAANKFKNFIGRVSGALARPLNTVARYMRAVIAAAMMFISAHLPTKKAAAPAATGTAPATAAA